MLKPQVNTFLGLTLNGKVNSATFGTVEDIQYDPNAS